MRVIGFGAHPDDVEIFFLGFLLCCQANGHDIGWVVATDGSQGLEDEYATLSAIDLAAIRQREAKAAAKQVGVQPVLLNLPDASLKPDAELAEIVAEQISALSPDLIVTHAASDYHADHRALSLAVSNAAGSQVPVLFADTMRGIGFDPMRCVDVTAHFSRKLDAIRCHESQLPERFVYLARTMNAFRALQCKLEADSYAEAFRIGSSLTLTQFESILPRGLVRPVASNMS